MARKPLIGISMRLDLVTDRFYLARQYSEALEGSGATPILLPLIPNAAYLGDILDRVDGILLPGSDSDTDPERYGEDPHPKLGKVVPERDEVDSILLDGIEERKLPLLAICFGMQALNVSRGGSLIQDIGSQVPNPIKHEQGEPWNNNTHFIDLEEASLIRELAGTARVKTNSHHHQAVKQVGRQLKVTARSSDGIVECIEDARPDRFALGVQWHPELSWRWDALSAAIFGRFVEVTSSNL